MKFSYVFAGTTFLNFGQTFFCIYVFDQTFVFYVFEKLIFFTFMTKLFFGQNILFGKTSFGKLHSCETSFGELHLAKLNLAKLHLA